MWLKIKKNVLFFFSLIVIGSITSSVYANETGYLNNPYPDKAVIKELKHIEELKSIYSIKDKDEKFKSLNHYLEEKSTKELLEIAAELETTSSNFTVDSMVIAPHLKDKFKDGIPVDTYNILIDKEFKPRFKMFVLDSMTNSEVKSKTLKNTNFSKNIKTIISDKSIDPAYKTYTLKKLNENFESPQQLELEKIVFDSLEASGVRGAAITAMRRTKNPNYKNVLTKIFSDKEIKDDKILRYAVVSAAKSGDLGDYISDVEYLSNNTQSSDLLNSIIYALGITGNEESINLIVKLYKEGENEEIVKYSMIINEKKIIEMLNSGNPNYITPALHATLYGNITTAIPSLKVLETNQNLDSGIRELALNVKNKLDLSNPFEIYMERWREK